MATLAAKAIRGATARDDLSAELAELGKRLDVVMPDRPARSADPELQPILETEWQTAFVRSVNAALSNLAASDEAPGGYDGLTVAMLREDLSRRGIEIPSGINKADLIALLMADDAADDEDESP